MSSARVPSMANRVRLIAACMGLVMAFNPVATAQPPTLNDVRSRLDQYLVAYESKLSTVVADEAYEQQYAYTAGRQSSTEKRVLKSDFVFLKLPGDTPWFGLRDTLLVDGKPVRDRDARLQRLLSEGSDSALRQALRIGAENARYNLGDFDRTLNVPTQVLDLLHPRHVGRFTFRKIGVEAIDGAARWRLGFREVMKPTLIKTREGANQPASGSIWVDPADGAVVRTSLDVGGDRAVEMMKTKITVEFALDPQLQFRVPITMVDVYYRPGMQISGQATYSNFRQFQTAVRILPDQ